MWRRRRRRREYKRIVVVVVVVVEYKLLSSYANRRPKLARLLNCFARKPLGKPKLDPKSGYYLSFKPVT